MISFALVSAVHALPRICVLCAAAPWHSVTVVVCMYIYIFSSFNRVVVDLNIADKMSCSVRYYLIRVQCLIEEQVE